MDKVLSLQGLANIGFGQLIHSKAGSQQEIEALLPFNLKQDNLMVGNFRGLIGVMNLLDACTVRDILHLQRCFLVGGIRRKEAVKITV